MGIGACIMGLAYGLGTIIWTLVLAHLCESLGLTKAMYVTTGIFVLLRAIPSWMAVVGKFKSPPTMVAIRPTADVNDAEVVQDSSALGSHMSRKTTPATVKNLLVSLDFWQLCCHSFMLVGAGNGMKLLLTPIFSATYD